MTHLNKTLAKTLIFSTTAGAFAFGAANAYAVDQKPLSVTDGQAQIWVHEKTAISDMPPIIRVEAPLPNMIVPLDTNIRFTNTSMQTVKTDPTYHSETDLRSFDLVEDSPVFIGARGASEFDTRDALRDSGSYPEQMGVQPLFTVAGAGLSTEF